MAIKRMDILKRMSDIVVHNGTIYLSGQVGDGDSVADQTKSALAAVDALLAKANSDRSHLLAATVWLSDMAYYDEMNLVWDTWVDQGNPPARACGEARLAAPELKVEIIVTAAERV